MWTVTEGISNSGGNLALHLLGNLNHFIGATLGNTGYVRDRDAEFGEKNVPRNDMAGRIDSTASMIKDVLTKLEEKDMENIYPIPVLGYEMTAGFFLMYLTSHLGYHLGQINYHRRLIKK